MPELPEVETTRRGIEPYVVDRTVVDIRVRNPALRWPVPHSLCELQGQTITSVRRRAKYLLLGADTGTVIIHLGMSGSLRVLPAEVGAGPYDHVDFRLESGRVIRLRDPRRFGCVLWTRAPPDRHPLLESLGPEPLSSKLSGEYLYQCARQRRINVKSFIMDSHTISGVGNIYANEALFESGIHPHRPAGRIAPRRYQQLARAIKQTLQRAIAAGGTTLKDFTREDGNPGYFRPQLKVYGRAGEPCLNCQTPIRRQVIGQRSSFLCVRCQR